jgi:hypothetical protein
MFKFELDFGYSVTGLKKKYIISKALSYTTTSQLDDHHFMK